MSQRCLDFDPQVASSMPTEEQTPFIHHASPLRNSSNFPCGNGSAESERPLKNPVVRSRMPSGIGLHLNSLGTFPASSKGSPYGSNLMTASSSKESSKAFAGSAGSEFVLSVLESAETDYREQEAPGSGQSDKGQCVQSLLTVSVEDFPFNIQNKVSQVGRKRLLLDQGATDGENANEGTTSARKRRKSGTPDECCKRCSCKKSKCLKLYCECFASGSYCLDSCACRNCSNKPEYEEKVAEIRQQIQSRNPLAFVPRVVLSTISAYKESHEGVPAMSKHKRGCNCKKSQCLKKYCECYQAQVGCSVSCKCNGCRNTFGLDSLPDDRSTYGQGAITAASDDLANGNEDFLFGTPISPGLLTAIAPEHPGVNLQVRDLESPLRQAASTCSKSSSNFNTFATPLDRSYGGVNNQVSPELSRSKTSTPKPTCQRQLRPRTMVTRSSANQNDFGGGSRCHQGLMSGKTGSNSLPPGVHSLQSKVLDAGSAAVSQEEDGFPDFLLDPSEVQSPTVTSSPKKKRVTPPQVSVNTQVGSKINLPPVLKNGRKLTLQALPSLPSVTSIRENSRPKKKKAQIP